MFSRLLSNLNAVLRLRDELHSDLAYAFRGLRRNALLSAAVVLTLTLGIGMNTGVYTLIIAMALRPRVDQDPGCASARCGPFS